MFSRRNIVFLLMSLSIFVFFVAVSDILFPFVVAILSAYLLDPIVDKMEGRLGRNISALIVTTIFFAIIVVVMIYILPIIYHQVNNFIHQLPNYIEFIRNDLLPKIDDKYISQGKDLIQGNTVAIGNFILSAVNSAVSSGLSLINFISLMLISPVVTFYMLRDWDIAINKLKAIIIHEYRDNIIELFRRIDSTLSAFIRGQINVAVILSIFYVTCLMALGLKYALLIGIITGILSFIPFVGFSIGFISALVVGYFQFAELSGLIPILVIFGIGQILEGYILVPYLVGNKLGLHPIWVIFALLAGGSLYGFTGMLIALPMAAIISVTLGFVYEKNLKPKEKTEQ